MHANPEDKFYIPENVYIIGTMNDVDRSVDTFDFAMSRRFRFIKISPDQTISMLDKLDNSKKEKAKQRMKSLNKQIVNTEGLNENYQIGAAYFLKLDNLDFDDLWNDCLEPLLQDYIAGMCNESKIMNDFKNAYYKADNDKDLQDNR